MIARTTFCFPDSVFEPTDFGGSEMLPHLCARADASGFDDLDDYVEAHIHGTVSFADDVEAIVLDPVFAGSAVASVAMSLGCAVEFHPGYRVASADLDPDFRGAEIVELAQSLGAELTPDVIGDTARSGRYDLQSLKRVWHHLAHCGRRKDGASDSAV